MQINGKHLDKIIAASVEKVTKKSGDKLKLHVSRTIQTNQRMCELKVGNHVTSWFLNMQLDRNILIIDAVVLR